MNWKTTGTILDGARSDSSCSSTDKASGMTAKMQEITMELRENRKERERLLKRIDGHRHASEYVARTAHKSARPTQYSDQAAERMASHAGNFAGPAAGPAIFSGAQPLWLQRLACCHCFRRRLCRRTGHGRRFLHQVPATLG